MYPSQKMKAVEILLNDELEMLINDWLAKCKCSTNSNSMISLILVTLLTLFELGSVICLGTFSFSLSDFSFFGFFFFLSFFFSSLSNLSLAYGSGNLPLCWLDHLAIFCNKKDLYQFPFSLSAVKPEPYFYQLVYSQRKCRTFVIWKNMCPKICTIQSCTFPNKIKFGTKRVFSISPLEDIFNRFSITKQWRQPVWPLTMICVFETNPQAALYLQLSPRVFKGTISPSSIQERLSSAHGLHIHTQKSLLSLLLNFYMCVCVLILYE